MFAETKQAVFRAARAIGLFAAARRATRRRIRILGYHAFATQDEARFRSKLFIRAATFRRRLEYLRQKGFRLIHLDEAIDRLRRGDVEPDTVVITIDDGFASTLSVAAPVLREFACPATVYLTTYHMAKQTPVFDLVMAYLLWKAPDTALPVPIPPLTEPQSLATESQRQAVAARLIELGHQLAREEDRVQLCRDVGRAVGVDYDAVAARGSFRLLSFDEARRLRGMNVNLGLHTHRHRFPPEDPDICRQELEDNRQWLARELAVRSEHFCYPSGVYSPDQWQLLSSCAVASATTCDTGLVHQGDSMFGLRRFLDGEMVTDLEFEAELCGFAELLRGALRIDRRAARE